MRGVRVISRAGLAGKGRDDVLETDDRDCVYRLHAGSVPENVAEEDSTQNENSKSLRRGGWQEEGGSGRGLVKGNCQGDAGVTSSKLMIGDCL